jgi:hypothetical protein
MERLMTYAFIDTPEYAWRCHIGYNLVYQLEEGRQPNAFHRLMQRLCFGIRWERV